MMSTKDDQVLVVRPAPEDAELAALLTVLALRPIAAGVAPVRARSPWAGETWRGGTGVWRRSGLPR